MLPLFSIGCAGTDGATEDLGHADDAFSTTPGEPNHERVTQTALSFLRPEVLTALTATNVATDVEFFTVNANHFDDCNFSGGSQVIRNSQAEAVEQLNPALPRIESDARALRAFGRSLHAAQDFYAHSNWVELGGAVLVDRTLAPFPILRPYAPIPSTGFIVIQGPKPKKAALTRKADASYPDNAVVTLRDKGKTSLGLISGTVDYEPGNFCPAPVAMTHDELNKDKSTLPERVRQYETALSLAIEQSRHEWCRLNQLVGARWGEAGKARLAAWVSDPSLAPDCTVE